MADKEDFLDELIAERTRNNPKFPKLVEAALQRRRDARGEDPNDASLGEEEAEEQPTAPNVGA